MNPIRYTVTGTGTGAIARMDYLQNPFSVGIGCVVGTGSTVNYSVQHTFDNLDTTAAANVYWFNNANITAASASQNTNYAFPVTGVRLNVTSATGTGNVTITIIQASNAP